MKLGDPIFPLPKLPPLPYACGLLVTRGYSELAMQLLRHAVKAGAHSLTHPVFEPLSIYPSSPAIVARYCEQLPKLHEFSLSQNHEEN